MVSLRQSPDRQRPDGQPPDRPPPDRHLPDGGEKAEAEARLRREMGRTLGLGFQFAASVAVLTLGGYWLDGRVGSLPLFTILGALLGFAGGTYSLVRRFPTTPTD